MTADSLKGIPAVSVIVKRDGRGTYSNDQGVFSIVVVKGDQIEFSSVGYKTYILNVPDTFHGNQYSIIQLMVTDAQFLPATIIKPRPTREQFERDFVNTPVPDDDIEIARQNTDAAKRRVLARTLPASPGEAASFYLKQQATRYYYQGHATPQNIFNPIAANLDRQITKGLLTEEEKKATLAAITPHTEMGAGVEKAALVVEAATENTDLKLKIFRQLDELAPPGCILASNTSSISITKIASATSRPQSFIG